MRRLELNGYGDLSRVLRVVDADPPTPGPDDLRLRVTAASINPIDFKIAQGALRGVLPLTFPAALGFDACGVIDAVGERVRDFAVGERVCTRLPRQRLGSFADFAVVDASLVARPPASLSDVEAATLPLVALTTLQGLVDRGRAQRGERVLIHAGSGGLGSFAIVYARRVLGLVVHTTTSSRNADWVAALGAERVFAYDREDYRTSGERYDLVFDTLGGAATRHAFALLRPGGRVVSVAGPPDRDFARQVGAGFPLSVVLTLMSWPPRLRAARAGARYFRFLTESSGTQLATLAQQVEAAGIHPVIDRVVPLDDAVAALEYAATGRARGKIVLVTAQSAA
jgi:alcohol dehydrogenase